jgi:hypothetical protein|nr:MAG TPA: hypothetical protein [Caudoviricetes sp.]
MSKFIKGELVQYWFGKTVVFLNYCIAGAECIVYNPKRDVFEVLDSRRLKPIDRYGFHRYTIDVENGIDSIKEEYNFKMFDLYFKALPIAEKHLALFKSLEGCTLDLSDSKLQVTNVTIGENESHDWKDLIEITGVRTRNDCSKNYCAPLSVLNPNSKLLRKMTEQTCEDL